MVDGLTRTQRFLWIWLPLFLVMQFVSGSMIGSREPDGFDRCTAAPTPGDARTQVILAIVAAAICVVSAAVLLRGWWLIVALWLIVFFSGPYLILLQTASSMC